ncbi:hypothetical protein BpHYR1_017447 [Brachionus plicatilis]|uniref:Uncharacterized protein n=1 Tax=Brachionus plicatilis TaxID=10195 RepID=A0A3M7R3M4_BRAPC|nr:hypothetical protein BpHYR1_017447 [Brachionus plicatilis]
MSLYHSNYKNNYYSPKFQIALISFTLFYKINCFCQKSFEKNRLLEKIIKIKSPILDFNLGFLEKIKKKITNDTHKRFKCNCLAL